MVDLFEQIDLDKVINDVSVKLQDQPQLSDNSINQIDKDSKPNEEIQINNETPLNLDLNLVMNINDPSTQYDHLFNPNANMSNISQSPNKKVTPLSLSDLKNDTSLLIKSNSFQKDEYLKVTDWKISNNDFLIQIEQKFSIICSSINKTEFFKLSQSITNCSLERAPIYPNIGPLSTLDYLVENQFLSNKRKLEQMSFHIVQLEDYLFRCRIIKGDGNCFYRAIIFSFLENIIMTNNICLLKEIIIDINEKFNDTYNNTRYLPFIKKEISKIDKQLCILILLLLEESMENKSNSQLLPYEILINSFLFCNKFDHCMIFYLRFLLFEFIKTNWNKVYSTVFSVKIGNLLPLKYQTQYGDFLYDKFFEEDLLKMGSEAEKIVIYLAPLVIKCDLNVLIYNFDYEEEAVSPISFPSFLQNKPKIEVLYRKTHYDLLYNKVYYHAYSKELDYYLNLKETQRLIKPKDLVPLREIKKKSQEAQIRLGIKQENDINEFNTSSKDKISIQCPICKLNYNHTQNILNICINCLLNEIDNQILGFYLQYLYQSKDTWINTKYSFTLLFDKLFNKQQCIIANHKLSLESAAEMSGKSLHDIMINIKKKLCVFCYNSIASQSQIWYEMPCGCLICSKKCFENYFELYLLSQLPITKETKNYSAILDSCICGYQFNNNDYISLYKFFEEKESSKLKKTIKEIILKKFQMCCLGCMSSNDNQYFRMILKGGMITEVFKKKEFNHLICQYCLKKYENELYIYCLLCNSNHQIVKVIPFGLDEENDTCILF